MRKPQLQKRGTRATQQVINLLAQDIEAAQIGIIGRQIVYVGKHGNDSNSGLSIQKAKLTFGAAVATAVAAAPSSANRFAVVCSDAGNYTEDITLPSWVDLYAPEATIIGQMLVADNVNVTLDQIQTAVGIAVTKPVGGTGTCRFRARVLIATAGAIGALNLSAGGVFIYEVTQTFVENGFGIGDITSALGHMHVTCEDLYITGTGVGIARAGAGTIVGSINHVLEIGGGVGNGTGIVCLGGDFDLRIGELLSTTAYNVVAGAALRLFVNDITGTRIAAAGSTVNLTISGFARQQISMVAADATTNSGAFVRLGAGIFNLDGYPAGAVVNFQAACQSDSGQTYEVQVFDVTAGAYLPGTITDNNGALVVKSLGPLVLGAGQRIYEVHGRLTTGSGGGDLLHVPSALFDVSP